MKRSLTSALVAVSIFAMNSVSFAQAASLKDVMKAIGNDFGQIAKTMNDPAQNKANAALASDLQDKFKQARMLPVTFIAHLPVAQQAAALTKFQSYIDQEIGLSGKVAQAFTAGQADQAKTLLKQMNDLKTQGHSEFNPKPHP